MLILTRKKDESIVIGNDIVIKVVDVEEGRVKLGISAPGDVSIHRYEIYQAIQQENKEAAINRQVSIKDLDTLIKGKKTKEQG
ncbi:MAG: carbon storage regulator CsrA [Firmicutes bacterium]|jgi:carbon storage regulator|nr:carbon storage regulator CsrA [Bacillota bacterium]MDD3851475.1 carbon storage regulator CsrA [Bacillota bacterium]MDD4707768.1 carbon storage regulator CsrA [Bacillota bacterium]